MYTKLLAALLLALQLQQPSHAQAAPSALALSYQQQVDQRLDLPADEAQRYGVLALEVLAQSGVTLTLAQYVAVVDRDPKVQAILIYWLVPGTTSVLIGASPVSTGRPGQFDHFETPTGVFEHSMANPDYRAEGTKNTNGVRGYGAKGMRVFDLGWQQAERGWGKGGISKIRLQMHATDPDLLEPRLGSAQSKGCIRIPATLNRLLDQFGVLDADYEAARAAGRPVWVVPAARAPVAASGRYLIVVDTQRHERPAWSPEPARR